MRNQIRRNLRKTEARIHSNTIRLHLHICNPWKILKKKTKQRSNRSRSSPRATGTTFAGSSAPAVSSAARHLAEDQRDAEANGLKRDFQIQFTGSQWQLRAPFIEEYGGDSENRPYTCHVCEWFFWRVAFIILINYIKIDMWFIIFLNHIIIFYHYYKKSDYFNSVIGKFILIIFYKYIIKITITSLIPLNELNYMNYFFIVFY